MTIARTFLALPLVLLTALATPAFAEGQHAVDPNVLATTVDQHVAQHDADRAAIREALTRPEVRDMATRLGVDVDLVTASLGTLGGEDLTRAGDTARQVNDQLVGGATTVTFTTTTIIIILLLVILLIVALK